MDFKPPKKITSNITALRLAIKTRYLDAVGLASLSAKAEFKRYDK